MVLVKNLFHHREQQPIREGGHWPAKTRVLFALNIFPRVTLYNK